MPIAMIIPMMDAAAAPPVDRRSRHGTRCTEMRCAEVRWAENRMLAVVMLRRYEGAARGRVPRGTDPSRPGG